MSTGHDMQRSKLYASEHEGALDVLFRAIEFGSVDEVQRFVDRVLAWKVVRRRFPRPVVKVVPHVGGRSTSHAYGGSGHGVIHLLASHRSRLIVLHELAHCLAPRSAQSHGPEFAKLYLWLVHIVMGKPIARELRASFKKHGVRYRVVTEAQRANGRRLAASHGFGVQAKPADTLTGFAMDDEPFR